MYEEAREEEKEELRRIKQHIKESEALKQQELISIY